jgi:hypothetical protein
MAAEHTSGPLLIRASLRTEEMRKTAPMEAVGSMIGEARKPKKDILVQIYWNVARRYTCQ